MCFDIYVTNGQNKQTRQIYNFFLIMDYFLKKLVQKDVKKEPWIWKYII